MIVVPLKIVAPIDITTQPVTLGVPFPRGVLRDPATLGLFDDAGNPVLLQTKSLAKWVDGSVRWLLVDFLLAKVGKGNHSWELRTGEVVNTLPWPYLVDRSTDAITIEAGEIECQLSTGDWVIQFDRDSSPSIPSEWWICFHRSIVVQIRSLKDIVNGPVRTSVLFLGTMSEPAINFMPELSLFGGTELVRLRISFHNPYAAAHCGGLWDLGDPRSSRFKTLNLMLSRLEQPEIQWRTEGDSSFQPVEGRSIEIVQRSSGGDNWTSRTHVDHEGRNSSLFNGYQVHFDGKTVQGNRSQPTVIVRDQQRRIVVALPECWQQFPKSLKVSGDHLSIGLFPEQGDNLHELQGGEQKTCTVWMHLGNANDTLDELAWVHQPALVQVAPEWVEKCGVLPFFPTSIAPGVAGERFVSLMRDAVEGPDSFFAKRERIDEYGWRNYGELYADHENEHYPGPKPVVSHYNNQYDALNGLLMQYLRTGDPRWWQLADPLARHLYDIDIYHTDRDRPAYNGGMFWHTDHYKDAATATHRSYSKANKPPGKPYGGGPGNEHNWSSGLLTYYFLTGDPLAREAVLSLANWVIHRDDGSQTFVGLIDDGPTGLSSRTAGDGSYHGPGRGGGNSINALLDAWLLTDERRYLDKAEELIRRCIHPSDDLVAYDIVDPEERWSYTVFLSVLARYLELKRQADQIDEKFTYARASLLHYGRWMAAHEKPYFDQVEKLEFPNETWAAQEMRKANVLRLAARYAEEPERAAMLRRGEELADRAWHDIYRFETRTSTRSLAILMTEGLRDSYLRTHAEERVTETGPPTDFGEPSNFVPQRTRVKRQLKSVKGILRAIPRLLNPWRWFRALRTKQWW